MFPGFHLFGNGRDFLNHSCDELGPGETPTAVRTYSKGAIPAFRPGTGGFCGPLEWWTNGVPSDAPRLVYPTNLTPACCPQQPCNPWNINVTPVRTWKRLLTGDVWATTINTNSTWQGQSHDFPAIRCNIHAVGIPCNGFDSTTPPGIFITSPPTIARAAIVSYDAGTFTATYQFPRDAFQFANEFFSWTNPL